MLYFRRVGEIGCGVMYPIIMTNKQGKITQFWLNFLQCGTNNNAILTMQKPWKIDVPENTQYSEIKA